MAYRDRGRGRADPGRVRPQPRRAGPARARTAARGAGLHMTADPTAQARREMITSGQPAADLAADEGRRWTTDELRAEFEVIGYAAPFVVVRRRSDGLLGTLEFTHSPRVHFGWRPDYA